MQLVKNTKGREALRRFMSIMREPNPWPPIRTGLPLLRAMDPWANYRKGPYAMYALSEYVGEERVNGALRSLVEKKASSLATTLDADVLITAQKGDMGDWGDACRVAEGFS